MDSSNTTAARWRRKACSPALAGVAALTVGAIALAPSAALAGAATPPLLKPAGGSSSSTYLAGYQANPNGGLASAGVTFTMPKLTCTAAQDNDGAAAFIGVYIDNFDAYSFATAQCTDSGTAYDFNFSTPAGGFVEPGAVSPGDVVVASLFESGTATQAEIHDLTKGTGWVSGSPEKLADTKVDIGTYNELIDGLPEANFGKISFTSATVNGDDLGFDSPTRFNSLNGGDTLVKTGAVKTTAAGSAFTAQYKKSS
jgi:hypothetical protein